MALAAECGRAGSEWYGDVWPKIKAALDREGVTLTLEDQLEIFESYNAAEERRIPQVACRVVLVKDGQRLLQFDCPWCGRVHTHGGGFKTEELGRYFGPRVSHCLTYRGDYELVLETAVAA